MDYNAMKAMMDSNPQLFEQAKEQIGKMSPDEVQKLMSASQQMFNKQGQASPSATQFAPKKTCTKNGIPAEQKKADGNKSFREGNYSDAIDQYKECINLASTILEDNKDDDDCIPLNQLRISSYINIAACELKTESYNNVIDVCTKGLDMINNLYPNVNHPLKYKAYFRRGKAYHMLEQLDKSLSDLKQAKQLQNTDNAVETELSIVKKKLGIDYTVEEVDSDNEPEKLEPMKNKTYSFNPPNPSNLPPNMEGLFSDPNVLEQAKERMKDLTPETLTQQANMMKSISKSQLRSMNPRFTAMTDEQIDNTIMQMEMMASNPAMIKIAAEQLKNYDPRSGPPPSMSMPDMNDPEVMQNMMKNIDGKQMKNMMKMMSDNPEMLKEASKSMGTEVDEESIKKMSNMMDNMSEEDMEKMMKYAQKVQSVTKPFQFLIKPIFNMYQTLNRVSYGNANTIIASVIVACVCYMIF